MLEAAPLSPVKSPPNSDGVVASLAGVTKIFGGTVAVSDVTIELRAGEVLALLGENGAGKSTCVKLLAGVHKPDTGAVMIGGEQKRFSSPLEAQHSGVAVMHQHPGLFPDLSIAENLFIGQTGTKWKLDYGVMQAEAARLLRTVGLDADVSQPLGKCGHRNSSWWKSPARCRSMRASLSWMNRPPRSRSVRSSVCSVWWTGCANAVSP